GQADDEAGTGESGQLLSLRRKYGIRCRCGHGSARCDSTGRPRMAQLRTAAHHAGTAPTRLDRELETGLSIDARGQSALRAEAEVRGDDRFNHGRKVYPNLARQMVLTGVDQL